MRRTELSALKKIRGNFYICFRVFGKLLNHSKAPILSFGIMASKSESLKRGRERAWVEREWYACQ